MLNIAHRGASGRFPENTLCAFAAALAAGADWCELDIRLTRDGYPMVLHDATVERTSDGSGAVEQMTLAELKRLDVGTKFDARFGGERVPTLAEVFELVAGRCGVILELKAGHGEEAVCEMIRAHDAVAWTQVSCFEWELLARLRRVAPEISIGLLANRRPRQLLAAAVELGANTVNPRFDMVTPALCDAAHRQGLRLYAWTVDEPGVMSRLIADGVDGIMTNYPERLARLMDR